MNSKKWKQRYLKINQWSGGRLDIIKETIASSSKARVAQAAASLAYYAIFSIFPLLLLLVIGSSYFLGSKQAYEGVTRFVQGVIPISPQLIDKNLQHVIVARGAVGVIGFLTLLWSASGFFTNLAFNINLAWPVASRRNFLADRLIGLGMIAGLSLLLLLSFGLDEAINIVHLFKVNNILSLNIGILELFSMLGSWLMIFLLFLLLYRWVPKASARWSAITWGALIASIAWKSAIAGFGWYMGSSLQQYKLIYGSLSVIVALLLLIFILSLVMLLGAHLSAAINKWEREVKRKSK